VIDDSAMVEVRLLGMPLALRARATEHDQDLLRELMLVRVGADQPEVASVPARLLDLAEELRGSYGGFSARQDDLMEEAFDRGEESIDLTYTVPVHTAGFIQRVRAALDAVEEYCRTGRHLLTLAAPPDVAAYRRWVFDEFERQIAGGDPVPWSPAMVAPGATADLGSAGGGHA